MRNVKRLFSSILTNILFSRTGFSCLLIIFSCAFWILVNHPVLAKDYLLPADYLGSSDKFLKGFGDDIKDKFEEYFGLLVAFTGDVPPEITKAVADAKASVSAIAGVSTVALAVGLSPLGAMLSLRFLNMILSRV